ncbi:MAG: hypothetical protein MUE73_17190 [Planctomycetes bacterium]|jgi:hypothetical protein|nr:hypothetical protein [Planctomycetota bacterium]
MVGAVFFHKDAVRVSHEFCAVVGHGNTEHANGDYAVAGKKVHLCSIYDLSDCSEHEKMREELSRRDLLKDVKGTPTHIFYNPKDMTEISRFHSASMSQIENALEIAQKAMGKPVVWKEYQKIRKSLDEAKTAFEAGERRKALKALGDFDPKGMESLKGEAEVLKGQILAAGEKSIEEAVSLIETGDKAKALKILRAVLADYAGTDLAEKARELIPQAKDEAPAK